MKATRKLSRRSFVTQVSGGHPSPGGALTALIGMGKQETGMGDHDAAHPAAHGGAGDPESATDAS